MLILNKLNIDFNVFYVNFFLLKHNLFQESNGTIISEVTETTTLRVSHNTHLGVESYKLVSNTLSKNEDKTDVEKIQDSNFVITNGTTEKNDDKIISENEITLNDEKGMYLFLVS